MLILPKNLFLISSFVMHSNVFREARRCQILRSFPGNPHKHKHCLHLRSYPLEHRHHLPRHRVTAWQKRAAQTANSSPLHRPSILTSPSTSQIPPLEISAAVESALFIWEAYLLGVRSDWGRRPQINLLILERILPMEPHSDWGGVYIDQWTLEEWVRVCVHMCRFLQSSAEEPGGRWCLADGEPAGFSVWVMPAVSIRPLQSVWRGLLDAA